MYKLLLIFIFTIATAGTVTAQKYVYEDVSSEPAAVSKKTSHPPHVYSAIDIGGIRFGAFFAPALAWMHPTAATSDNGHYRVSNKGSKGGYSWGLIAEYYFAQNYGFVTGFNVSMLGGHIVSNANAGKVDTTLANTVVSADMNYRLQYLEIPFALKLRSDELPKTGMRVFGQIGLTLGFNISKKATYDITYKDASATTQEISGTNETLKGNLATAPVMIQLNVGGGIEYPITEKLYFFTSLSFNNGFLPSAINPQNFDLGYKGSFTNPNIRLNSLALRIGLFF